MFKFTSNLTEPRLAGPDDYNLNMYRAMGDLILKDVGLEHHPDIYEEVVEIPEGGSAFVINACDGLTEAMSQRQLKEVIQNNIHLPLYKLPSILGIEALHYGSQDNISVIVTPVEPDAEAKYIVILDGHGGTEVSQFLSENFPKELVKQALLTANKKAAVTNNPIDNRSHSPGKKFSS